MFSLYRFPLRRDRWHVDGHSGFVAWLAVALLLNQWSSAFAQSGVGRRTRIQGEKNAAAVDTGHPFVLNVGSLRLSHSKMDAWKHAPMEMLVSEMPSQPAVYLIANSTDSNERLLTEIRKLGNTRILEENPNAVFIYTTRENASRLTALRDEEWLDIVEPLTAKRKLRPELQEYLAAVRPGAAEPDAEEVSPVAEPMAQPIEIVPEGVAPQPAAAADDAGLLLLPGDTQVNVTFYLFQNASDEAVREQIARVGGAVVASGRDDTINVVRALVPASKVETVAAEPAIREGTLDAEFVKHNDVAMRILVRNPPAFQAPIFGAGQIVGHSDSGLDRGVNDQSLHPAFRGRVKRAFALGRPAAADWSDLGGHGTHTAASILGAGKFPGIAPQAQLVHQSLDNQAGALTGIPTPLGTLFQQAYDEGARIHSNSWGVAAINRFGQNVNGGVYLRGQELDSWTWNNGQPRDMLIVVSAGNDGDFPVNAGRTTVTSPGTAKNCLTVGACENLRPTAGPAGDRVEDLASFSSKGPTRENRIKPDVVAPGTWIVSARTQGAQSPWFDNLENVTVNPTQSNAWKVTPGFQQANDNSALSGQGVFRLQRAMGATFQDVLTTPVVAVPAGHELFLEVWLRGNIGGLERFHLGYQTSAGTLVFTDRRQRQFPNWTQMSVRVPADIMGTNVRFVVVAQQTTPLPSNIDLQIDDLRLTTFSSWSALSSLNLAPANDPDDLQFTLSGGTSMSTPLTAGCAALVRESLMSEDFQPSAELIKAILINSADPHQGARPNFDSGWGMVHLRRAIEGNYQFDDDSALAEGEEMTYTVTVPENAGELRVTLVWADAPDPRLVNDLDLTLVSPTGTERFATAPDEITRDRTNNVEGIDQSEPEQGDWKVVVRAFKVTPGLNQPYAVVISQLPPATE